MTSALMSEYQLPPQECRLPISCKLYKDISPIMASLVKTTSSSLQSQIVWCCHPSQAVVVTDPTVAHEVLRYKVLDKFRFQYSFLDPVCTSSDSVVLTRL